MTIASAFNDIAVAQGGTAAKSGAITAAIDALNDALAGSDQPQAKTIEQAVRLLGEHIGGGGGGGDFTTAKATIQNGGQAPIFLSCALDSEQMTASMPLIMPSAAPVEYTAILYKGKAVLGVQGGTVTSSGSIEDAGQGMYLITGDCTVTVS